MLTYKDDYLMHYGIKGQKKGRRRFQNPDGSLTAAGRLRYLDPSAKKNSGSYIKTVASTSKKESGSALDRVENEDKTGGTASAASGAAITSAKFGEAVYRGYKSDYRSQGRNTNPNSPYDYNVLNMDRDGSFLTTEHYKEVNDKTGKHPYYEFAGVDVHRMSDAGVTKTYGKGKFDSFFSGEKEKPDVVQVTRDKHFPDRFTTYEGYWKDGSKRTVQYDSETGKIISDVKGHGFPKGSKGEAAVNSAAGSAAVGAIKGATKAVSSVGIPGSKKTSAEFTHDKAEASKRKVSDVVTEQRVKKAAQVAQSVMSKALGPFLSKTKNTESDKRKKTAKKTGGGRKDEIK